MAGYQRWLIARGNVFMPSSETIAKFVAELQKEGWIPAEGTAVHTVEKGGNGEEKLPATLDKEWLDNPNREELRMIWKATKYPLSIEPDGGSALLEVHRAPEYVVPVSKYIGALPVECKCGEELDFGWDEDEVTPAFRSSTGIFAECDECSRTFDPSTGSATIKNPFDGSKEKVPGGAAHRFALKVDCGEAFVRDPNLVFARELVALVEKAFGRSFYEVGALYE